MHAQTETVKYMCVNGRTAHGEKVSQAHNVLGQNVPLNPEYSKGANFRRTSDSESWADLRNFWWIVLFVQPLIDAADRGFQFEQYLWQGCFNQNTHLYVYEI